MDSMQTDPTEDSKTRKNEKLQAKIIHLRSKLDTARARISDLEKENENLKQVKRKQKEEISQLKKRILRLVDGNPPNARSNIIRHLTPTESSLPTKSFLASHIHAISLEEATHARKSNHSKPPPLNSPSLSRDSNPSPRLNSKNVTFNPTKEIIPHIASGKQETAQTTGTSNASLNPAEDPTDSAEVFNENTMGQYIHLQALAEGNYSVQHQASSSNAHNVSTEAETTLLVDSLTNFDIKPLDINNNHTYATTELLLRARQGDLHEIDLESIAQLHFVHDPAMDTFLRNQISTTSSTPSFASKSRSSFIEFLEPLDRSWFANTFPSPQRCNTSQIRKIRFRNVTDQELMVSIYTFATPGSFFGFHLSKSNLSPGDDSRLTYTFVGTKPINVSCFAVLCVSKPNFNHSTVVENPGYYFFGSHVSLVKSPELVWKLHLSHVIEDYSTILAMKKTYTIVRAELLGCDLCCIIFQQHDSLEDQASYQKHLSVLGRPSMNSQSIVNIIGVSERRPFRILTTPWLCTLASALNHHFSSSPTVPQSQAPHHESIPAIYDTLTSLDLDPLFNRVQIAIDVVDGLLFLQSNGMYHKDISSMAISLTSSSSAQIYEMEGVDVVEAGPKMKAAVRKQIFGIGTVMLELFSKCFIPHTVNFMELVEGQLQLWNSRLRHASKQANSSIPVLHTEMQATEYTHHGYVDLNSIKLMDLVESCIHDKSHSLELAQIKRKLESIKFALLE